MAALALDLRSNAPHVACVAGPDQDIEVQRWALAVNARLGAAGAGMVPSVRSDGDPSSAGTLKSLATSMVAGQVTALFVLGSNPAYSSVAFREVSGLVAKLPFSVHLGEYADETAALCAWHLPEAHFLETWGDLRAYDGTATILQPLIEPLFAGRSAVEMLRIMRQAGKARAATRSSGRPGGVGAPSPRRPGLAGCAAGTIDSGVSPAPPRGRPDPGPSRPCGTTRPAGRVEAWLSRPDSERPGRKVVQQRVASGSCRGPLTHIVWDNAALISSALAAQLGVANGDLLTLECARSSLEAAAWSDARAGRTTASPFRSDMEGPAPEASETGWDLTPTT